MEIFQTIVSFDHDVLSFEGVSWIYLRINMENIFIHELSAEISSIASLHSRLRILRIRSHFLVSSIQMHSE